METLVGTLLGTVIGISLGLIFLTFLGIILQLLWNSTLPELFGFKTITIWQAVKLLFISSLIFGGNRVINSDYNSISATPTQTQEKPV